MHKIFFIILFPFSLIYGLILSLRNKLYDWNIFKSTSFSTPIISVGNLSLGGTGKTPHIEYLINLLSPNLKIATLSRGYKRKTKGFFLSNENSTIEDIGDEPLQYRLKFKKLIVAVDEKRVNGIEEIKRIHPETEVILLDDAYQHRSLNPGINILITEFNKLYCNDYVIPSGKLREFKNGSKRADIIIVSKSPNTLSSAKRSHVIKELNPESNQSVYFSFIKYGMIKAFTSKAKEIVCSKGDLLLLTGIAKPEPLVEKLTQEFNSIEHIKYSDHHSFTDLDIFNIKDRYQNIESNNKIIITTEKDIMRLSLPSIFKQIQDIPIFYIPIEICFHINDKKEFDKKILDYVATNSRN